MNQIINEVNATSKTDENYQKNLRKILIALRDALVAGCEDGVSDLYEKSLSIYLDAVTDESFDFNRDYCYKYLEFNALIANIVCSCNLKNTDFYIDKVRSQSQGLYKRLLLTSTRCSVAELRDLVQHYDSDIPLFNSWTCSLFQISSAGFLDEHVIDNLNYIAEVVKDHEFTWGLGVNDLFNCVTYMASPYEKDVRACVSASFKKSFNVIKFNNEHKTNTIAVYSENWFPGHSTHRTTAKYFDKLFDKYKMVHLHGDRFAGIGSNDEQYKKFKEAHKIKLFGVFDPLEMAILGPSHLKFDAIIYPDAGFDTVSTIFANMRIAPVQISMTGFPISVFGGEIDYFVSGTEVEDLNLAQENYDERLVCLPGFGAIHERPPYNFEFITPKPKQDIIIGGSWIGPKTNIHMVKLLQAAFKQVSKKCTMRIFPGISWFIGNKIYMPYINKLKSFFDESLNLEIVEGVEAKDYLKLMNGVDCAVDSFPWGGSNTVSDCIHLSKPVVVLQGTRWFNRIGPAMLRSIGLEELIAKTDVEYVEKTIRLIEDDAWRIELTNRLFEMNAPYGLIDQRIYSCDNAADMFAQFVEDAIEQKFVAGRQPIIVNQQDGNNLYKYHTL